MIKFLINVRLQYNTRKPNHLYYAMENERNIKYSSDSLYDSFPMLQKKFINSNVTVLLVKVEKRKEIKT